MERGFTLMFREFVRGLFRLDTGGCKLINLPCIKLWMHTMGTAALNAPTASPLISRPTANCCQTWEAHS